MFEKIRNTVGKLRKTRQVNKQVKNVAEIAMNPDNRLEFLKASYRKFGPTLTLRERERLKKEIKRLERAMKKRSRH